MHSRSSGGHFAGLAAWLPQVPPASCSVVNFSLLALLRLCKKLDPFDEFYYYHEIYVFVVSESCSVVSDSLQPHGLYSPWNSPGQNTGVGSLSLLQGIFPNPGIEPRSPTLQVDSLPAEPQGKPKNTGVGCLSLLQQIFPTQESNQGLLHCGWILDQLSYQGCPGHEYINKIVSLC